MEHRKVETDEKYHFFFSVLGFVSADQRASCVTRWSTVHRTHLLKIMTQEVAFVEPTSWMFFDAHVMHLC